MMFKHQKDDVQKSTHPFFEKEVIKILKSKKSFNEQRSRVEAVDIVGRLYAIVMSERSVKKLDSLSEELRHSMACWSLYGTKAKQIREGNI
jgi:flagellar biosynthesis regulator FlaF